MKRNNQTKQKTTTINQKPPTPMGRSNGRSPHPAHCHMGRVSIQSKKNQDQECWCQASSGLV